MQADILKYVPDFSKLTDFSQHERIGNSVVSATMELFNINNRVLNTILDNQINLARVCVEGGEKQFGVANDISDLNVYQSKQTELFNEYVSIVTEASEKNISLAQITGDEYQEWFRKNIKSTEVPVTKSETKSRTATKPKAKKRS